MTVLEWLRASTRYTFNDDTFTKIAVDRGVQPCHDIMVIDDRAKELMTADIIFTAVLLSPSSTSSLQQSHNGYQKTVGSETDYYQADKIKYAMQIYNKYDDSRAEALDGVRKRIKFIPIVDVL